MENYKNKKKSIITTIINILCICLLYFAEVLIKNFALHNKIGETAASIVFGIITTVLLSCTVYGIIKTIKYKNGIISIIGGTVAAVITAILGFIPGISRHQDNSMYTIIAKASAVLLAFLFVYEIITLIHKIRMPSKI